MPSPEEHKQGCDGRCETIKVKSGKSYAVINAEDFDPKKHHKYEEEEAHHSKAEETHHGKVGR